MVAGVGLVHDESQRIQIVCTTFIITLISALVMRPYREIGSNMILMVLSLLFVMISF
jgi:hypothetical protein